MEYFNYSWCHWNSPQWHDSYQFLYWKKCSLHSCKCNDLVRNILLTSSHYFDHLSFVSSKINDIFNYLSRMDCLYRLLYSMIAVHYRNYIMSLALFQQTSGTDWVCNDVHWTLFRWTLCVIYIEQFILGLFTSKHVSYLLPCWLLNIPSRHSIP